MRIIIKTILFCYEFDLGDIFVRMTALNGYQREELIMMSILKALKSLVVTEETSKETLERLVSNVVNEAKAGESTQNIADTLQNKIHAAYEPLTYQVEVVSIHGKDENHSANCTLILVGRNPNSTLSDPRTWGPKTLVVDPINKKVTALSELKPPHFPARFNSSTTSGPDSEATLYSDRYHITNKAEEQKLQNISTVRSLALELLKTYQHEVKISENNYLEEMKQARKIAIDFKKALDLTMNDKISDKYQNEAIMVLGNANVVANFPIIVFGRQPNSHIENMGTWGADTLVINPYEKKVQTVRELQKTKAPHFLGLHHSGSGRRLDMEAGYFSREYVTAKVEPAKAADIEPARAAARL